MKVTKENLQSAKNGYLGYFISECHLPNLENQIDNITKANGDEIHIKSMHDSGPTEYTIEKFLKAYEGKTILVP